MSPKKPPKKPPQTIAAALRAAIEASEKSSRQIGREAGVNHCVIVRFTSNDRDLLVSTADKIAAVVGLTVTPPARKPAK